MFPLNYVTGTNIKCLLSGAKNQDHSQDCSIVELVKCIFKDLVSTKLVLRVHGIQGGAGVRSLVPTEEF